MVAQSQKRGYTARFKFQVIVEVIRGSKTMEQIGRAYGVHPITLTHWKKEFLEKGPEVFERHSAALAAYERRIGELERLLGQKEVEIALLKNFLGGSSLSKRSLT